MKRLWLLLGFIVVAIMLFVGAMVAFGAPAANMSGKWKIKWSRGTANNLTLTDTGGTVAGIYVNDTGEKCIATGNILPKGSIGMIIHCGKQTIWFSGSLADDVVTGNYTAEHQDNGSFKMERVICMIPEGCKD